MPTPHQTPLTLGAGGLGDVMGALPKALARRGHRTMVVAPRYSNYAEGWETGVRVSMRVMSADVEIGYFHGYIDGVDYVFVDHPCYHGRQDNIYGGDRGEVRSALQVEYGHVMNDAGHGNAFACQGAKHRAGSLSSISDFTDC